MAVKASVNLIMLEKKCLICILLPRCWHVFMIKSLDLLINLKCMGVMFMIFKKKAEFPTSN